MTRRREVLASAVLMLALAGTPASAAMPEGTDAVRRLAEAGATELALARVEARAPREPTAPQWAEWEGLRCELLGRLARHEALLARVEALPAGRLATPLNACLLEGARSALARGEPARAREHAARLLWLAQAGEEQVRHARLAVIESYVAERRGEDAFRSMLRFQQDYAPLARAAAERFADALLDLGLDREALNWLGTSAEASPARLRLQLRGASLAPESVIAQARSAFARNADPAYWRVVYEAAERARNPSVQVEALERMLQMEQERDTAALSQLAQRLWQAYAATAAQAGNKGELLIGDDGAWADLASRRLAADAFAARAIFAYLAQRASRPEARRNAQLQLVHSLESAGLDLAALRLLPHFGEIESLDPQARYRLGTIAARRNEAGIAHRLWNGLPAPANRDAAEWQLMLARAALRAGDAASVLNTLNRLASGRPASAPELAQKMLELANEALEERRLGTAQAIYALAVPLANAASAREALCGLAQAHDLAGEALAAAGAYLRCALAHPEATARALHARLSAAQNLARAGLKNDARAQFDWLLRNTKDPALLDAARRGLERL